MLSIQNPQKLITLFNQVNLLESYIQIALEAYLSEETATAEGFDLESFKQLSTLPQFLGYIERTLGNAKIGEGQGRSVYRLPDGKVLKIARNLSGIGQNEAEVSVCKNETTATIFPRIFDFDREFNWLIAEEAGRMTRVKFVELTGISWSEFIFVLGGAFPHSLSNPTKGQLAQYQHAYNKHYGNPFVRRVIGLIENCNYEPGDLAKIDSWGVIGNKPVIVDSGFTKTVQQTHYKGKL